LAFTLNNSLGAEFNLSVRLPQTQIAREGKILKTSVPTFSSLTYLSAYLRWHKVYYAVTFSYR